MTQLLIHPRLTNYFSSMIQLAGSLSLNITPKITQDITRTVALTTLFALMSCSASTDSSRTKILGIKIDPQLSDKQNLERFAKTEETSTRLSPLSVPPPPGIDPHILAHKTPIDPRALLSLDQALQEISNQFTNEPGKPPVRKELDSSAQAAALRHYLKGRDAAFENNHLRAQVEFDNSLKIDPYNTSVLRASARSYLATLRKRQAIIHYQRLLEVEPNDSEAIFEVGMSAAFKQQYIEAIARLGLGRLTGKSFEHDPGADVLASFLLYESLRQLGYDRASIQIAHQVIDNPFNFTKPTVHIKRIESIHIQKPEIWRKIGDAHCRLGEYEQALNGYEVSASFPISDPSPVCYRII